MNYMAKAFSSMAAIWFWIRPVMCSIVPIVLLWSKMDSNSVALDGYRLQRCQKKTLLQKSYEEPQYFYQEKYDWHSSLEFCFSPKLASAVPQFYTLATWRKTSYWIIWKTKTRWGRQRKESFQKIKPYPNFPSLFRWSVPIQSCGEEMTIDLGEIGMRNVECVCVCTISLPSEPADTSELGWWWGRDWRRCPGAWPAGGYMWGQS